VTQPAAEVIGLVQGIMPQSIGEWRVAVGLSKVKLEFRYQVPLYGGRVAGGYVLDFLVYAPFPIPLEIFGEHWHRGELNGQERMKLEREKLIWGQDTIVFWFQDLQNQRETDRAIRKAFL
jgi:hypothetical protein